MDGAVLAAPAAPRVVQPYAVQQREHVRLRKQFDDRIVNNSRSETAYFSTNVRSLGAGIAAEPISNATSSRPQALRFVDASHPAAAAAAAAAAVAAESIGTLSVHQHIEGYHRPQVRTAPINFSAPRSPGLPSLRVDSVHTSSPPKHHQSSTSPRIRYERDLEEIRMDALNPSGSTSSLHLREHEASRPLATRPFQLRHGRRYIRDDSYPLPCDLQELQRQNLKTMLACTVFGRPVCSPHVLTRPPQRVLEIGCGTAYWTTQCHKMFSAMGHEDIEYTGFDIASLAPNLKKQGLNWTFVRHDIRSRPWPFDDESFDLVVCKDMSIAVPTGARSQWTMDECIRLLRPGGTLEIWESDYTIRSLQPHVPALRKDEWEQKLAEHTATFPMTPSTPFAPVQNRYLKQANTWIEKCMTERNLSSTPCVRIAPALLQEPDDLEDLGVRRIAIPLGEMEWDRPREHVERKGRSRSRPPVKLDVEQNAIRETALLVTLQMIESLEPLLKETSGKNTEEWSYWWASLMMSLTQGMSSKRPFNGECLEIGAWWAVKS